MWSLETQRLALKPFIARDIDLLIELHTDPEVTKLVGWPKPPSIQENNTWLNKTLNAYEVDGLAQLAVYLKDSNEFIGRAGLRIVEIEKKPKEDLVEWHWYRGSAPKGAEIERCTEIGYTYAAAHWGKGYATESVKGLCNHAFTQGIDDSIYAATFPENIASKRVLEKAGFIDSGDVLGMGKTLNTHKLVSS